jgi:hypothetical protein
VCTWTLTLLPEILFVVLTQITHCLNVVFNK